jgi:hypothetical protein
VALADYTAGIGGQDHADNAHIHPWPVHTERFMAAFESGNWARALEVLEDTEAASGHGREGDVGVLTRKMLMQLRTGSVDAAEATCVVFPYPYYGVYVATLWLFFRATFGLNNTMIHACTKVPHAAARRGG